MVKTQLVHVGIRESTCRMTAVSHRRPVILRVSGSNRFPSPPARITPQRWSEWPTLRADFLLHDILAGLVAPAAVRTETAEAPVPRKPVSIQ